MGPGSGRTAIDGQPPGRERASDVAGDRRVGEAARERVRERRAENSRIWEFEE
eukprot:COSAG02_NODE_47401_length_341_cov_0.888430_1_plen_53_part_00